MKCSSTTMEIHKGIVVRARDVLVEKFGALDCGRVVVIAGGWFCWFNLNSAGGECLCLLCDRQ